MPSKKVTKWCRDVIGECTQSDNESNKSDENGMHNANDDNNENNTNQSTAIKSKYDSSPFNPMKTHVCNDKRKINDLKNEIKNLNCTIRLLSNNRRNLQRNNNKLIEKYSDEITTNESLDLSSKIGAAVEKIVSDKPHDRHGNKRVKLEVAKATIDENFSGGTCHNELKAWFINKYRKKRILHVTC